MSVFRAINCCHKEDKIQYIKGYPVLCSYIGVDRCPAVDATQVTPLVLTITGQVPLAGKAKCSKTVRETTQKLCSGVRDAARRSVTQLG